MEAGGGGQEWSVTWRRGGQEVECDMEAGEGRCGGVKSYYWGRHKRERKVRGCRSSRCLLKMYCNFLLPVLFGKIRPITLDHTWKLQ